MNEKHIPSKEYVDRICELYGNPYDDRIEDSRPPAARNNNKIPGKDWIPGKKSKHKSLIAFQRELKTIGISISTSKIRKILITGGCWSTDSSRRIRALYDLYTTVNGKNTQNMTSEEAIRKIAEELNVSIVTVNVNLPYQSVVYNLEDKSSNALRCERHRENRKNTSLRSDIKDEIKDLQNMVNSSSVFKSLTELSDKNNKRYEELNEIMNRLRVVLPTALKNISYLSDQIDTAVVKFQDNKDTINNVIGRAVETSQRMKTFSKAIDSFISSGTINKIQSVLNGLPRDIKDTKLYNKVDELYVKKDICYDDIRWVTDFCSSEGSMWDYRTCFDEYAADNDLFNYIRYIIELNSIDKREKLILLLSHFESLIYYTLSIKKELNRPPLKTEVHTTALIDNSGISSASVAKLYIAAIVFIVFARTEKFITIDARIPFRNHILHNGIIGYSEKNVEMAYDLLVKYVCILVRIGIFL